MEEKVNCTFELCERCNRHASITITGDDGRSESLHVPSKEHAMYFVHIAMIEGLVTDPLVLLKIKEEIQSSQLPNVAQASEKRLFHIDFVNRHRERFSDFSLEDICLTIFIISPKLIPKGWKEEEIRSCIKFSPH